MEADAPRAKGQLESWEEEGASPPASSGSRARPHLGFGFSLQDSGECSSAVVSGTQETDARSPPNLLSRPPVAL